MSKSNEKEDVSDKRGCGGESTGLIETVREAGQHNGRFSCTIRDPKRVTNNK